MGLFDALGLPPAKLERATTSTSPPSPAPDTGVPRPQEVLGPPFEGEDDPPTAPAVEAIPVETYVVPPTSALVRREVPPDDLARPLEPIPKGFELPGSPNTRRAFAADLRSYSAWCDARHPGGVTAFDGAPERAVASYLYWLATTPFTDGRGTLQPGRKLTTIERHLTGVRAYYRARRVPFNRQHPAIEEALLRIRHGLAGTPQALRDQARPLRLADLEALFAVLEWWDRTMLAIGFWAALRQDELRHLLFDDLRITEEGLTVRIRASKTTRRRAKVEFVGVPYAKEHVSLCATRAYADLLARTSRREGYVFTGRDGVSPVGESYIGKRIKWAAAAVGSPVEVVEAFSSHSMRRGAATLIGRKGLEVVMKQTRHASKEQAREYVEANSVFHDNPLDGII